MSISIIDFSNQSSYISKKKYNTTRNYHMKGRCMIMNKMKLAGVTFNNKPEDGGKSRQQILAELPTYITVILKHVKFYNENTDSYEDAIKCIEKTTGQVIGWIPRPLINTLWRTYSLTGIVSCYKNTYGVELVETQKPSQAQYWAVKRSCETTGQPLPAYDARAYTNYIICNEKR